MCVSGTFLVIKTRNQKKKTFFDYVFLFVYTCIYYIVPLRSVGRHECLLFSLGRYAICYLPLSAIR